MKCFKTLLMLMLILTAVSCSAGAETPDITPAVATVTPAPALKPVTRQPAAAETVAESASRAEATAAAILEPSSLVDGLIPIMGKNEMDADDVLLVYHRAGGLAGIRANQFTWTFHADGRVLVSDGRAWELAPADITELVTGIAANGFFDLSTSYVPEDTCCDRAYHAITLNGAESAHSVVTLDGVENPPALSEALDTINDLLFALPQ